jgi:hypothetical protein
VNELINGDDRAAFYESYPYQITPPTDDRPFFFHFFRWSQTPQVLASLGRTWQPFGGSGYLVLLALLALTLILGTGLILLPLALRGDKRGRVRFGRSRVLLFFAFLGIGFLFVEIPLIQHWIMWLGHPTYAFALVVAALLTFSGLGSALSGNSRLQGRTVLAILVLFIALTTVGVARFSDLILSWPRWARGIVPLIGLAPLGVLMGMPFPLGLSRLKEVAPGWLPWAWAVNGCTSVVASVLAAMLSLSYGFSFVLYLGAGAYLGAAVLFMNPPTHE